MKGLCNVTQIVGTSLPMAVRMAYCLQDYRVSDYRDSRRSIWKDTRIDLYTGVWDFAVKISALDSVRISQDEQRICPTSAE